MSLIRRGDINWCPKEAKEQSEVKLSRKSRVNPRSCLQRVNTSLLPVLRAFHHSMRLPCGKSNSYFNHHEGEREYRCERG